VISFLFFSFSFVFSSFELHPNLRGGVAREPLGPFLLEDLPSSLERAVLGLQAFVELLEHWDFERGHWASWVFDIFCSSFTVFSERRAA
jgi:hypothetical protein